MTTPTGIKPRRMTLMQWDGLDGARVRYLHGRHANLRFLLANRIEWMNQFISAEHDEGIELGCGFGFSKDFIRAKRFLLTDVQELPWADVAPVDALATPFADRSQDFVVATNMLHHVARPMQFFEEMHRILKPGGRLLIQDMNASWCMRAILDLTKHEPCSLAADVFDRNAVCNDPAKPWSANCAIPSLLFDDLDRFRKHVPCFDVIHTGFSELLTWINSGGVNARTLYVPLPKPALRLLASIDRLLIKLSPRFFALQRQVVLRNRAS